MSTKSEIKKLIDTIADDRELYVALTTLSRNVWDFGQSVGVWGPRLYERNRRVFSPLIEKYLSVWGLRGGKNLDVWMAQAEENGDLRIFRGLYQAWVSETFGWGGATAHWQADFTKAFQDARNRGERRDVVEKYNIWFDLDDGFTAQLYGIDPVVTRSYLIQRLDRTDWHDIVYEETANAAREAGDEAFYFELYRRTFLPATWQADVKELAGSVSDPAELCRELELRHLQGPDGAVDAKTLLLLLKQRGEDVLPYLERRVGEVQSWGNDKAWATFGDYAAEHGFHNLWATVVKAHFQGPRFAKVVKTLCVSEAPEWQRASQLVSIAGAQTGWFEWRRYTVLEQSAAVALYDAFPEFCRGPFAVHLQVTPKVAYQKLAERAAKAGDLAMIDVLTASAVVATAGFYSRQPITNLDWYIRHYQSLDDEQFGLRALEVLCRIDAFEHYGMRNIRLYNPLYPIFFRNVKRYKSAVGQVRDLLEASCEEARRVGLRLIVEERAVDQAVRNADHLAAYLLDEATRATRIEAFKALAIAADHSEIVAQDVIFRAREALDLRRKAYPRDRLIELIGRVLHRWPSLRGPTEQPVVYSEEASW